MISDLKTRIVLRMSMDGYPFTELLHEWTDDTGTRRCALSRCNYAASLGKHAEAAQCAAFMERRKRWSA